LLLEFSIPRKELRIDIVLLIGEVVVAIEAKTALAASRAKRQVEEYALLLHYFHRASSECRIVPVIVSMEAGEANYDAINQREKLQREANEQANMSFSAACEARDYSVGFRRGLKLPPPPDGVFR